MSAAPGRRVRSSIPRRILVRRWALVLSCLLALVAAVSLPIGLHAHSARARAAVLRTRVDAAEKGGCAGSGNGAAGRVSASASSCASGGAGTDGETLDWVSPSGGAQPDLSKYSDLSVRVSLTDQRVYVMSGSKVIYTMICSSGVGDDTPTGSFQVQNRGTSFYNASEGMGANYWVSWKGWGEYLFHTVPTDRNGQYIVSEAHKLGRKASDGCIRLTVDDAEWLYRELPAGTTVVIG